MNIQFLPSINLRDYQLPVFKAMVSGKKNRAICVWHRRAGKDVTAMAIESVLAHKRIGCYWHMMPVAEQCRKALWDGMTGNGERIIDKAFPFKIRDKTNDTEMRIEFLNGSSWQLTGSDNYQKLLGSNPIGITFSEYSVSKPSAWEYLRPILAENGGVSMMLFTPRGNNHGKRLFDITEGDKNWCRQLLTVDDTGVISKSAIEEERRAGMSESMIQQEFYCSWTASLIGAIYDQEMRLWDSDKARQSILYDPAYPVITAWDLGISDKTSIWFIQEIGDEIRLFDYYESSGHALKHYIKNVLGRDYLYSRHIAPHDIEVREFGSGRSRIEIAMSLGLRFEVAKKRSVEDGIESVRSLFPRFMISPQKCAIGIEALRHYRREWDAEKRDLGPHPYHDWASHACDALRMYAISYRRHKARQHGSVEQPKLAIV